MLKQPIQDTPRKSPENDPVLPVESYVRRTVVDNISCNACDARSVAKRGVGCNLGQMLVLLLPVLGISDAESMAEDLSDRLERHAFALRITEDDEDPTDETDAAIESEGAAGSYTFHHREECGGDNDVCAPTGGSVLPI